jgi:[lysine-biosynthesis-protein LysW]---L-2-aminoadipate ligase
VSHQRGPAAIAVLASQLRLDEKRLLEAMERRGMACEHVDTRALWSTLDGRARRWRGALNREIGLVRALYAARALEWTGVPVINDAAAIEVCGDKWRTSLALAASGLPVPRTALALTSEAALAALEDIGYPALIKPVTGSWGRLIIRLRDAEMASEVLEYVRALPGPQSHLCYVQEFITTPGRDIRAIVIGGEFLGAVYRIAEGTRTNVARGARSERCRESAEIAKLATAAAAAVAADIAAVDLVEDPAGRVLLVEVNHRVEFSGFQAAMGGQVDVAGRIADHLSARAERW